VSTWWVLFAGEVPEDGDLVTSRRAAAAVATASVAPHVRGTGEPHERKREKQRVCGRTKGRPATSNRSGSVARLVPWALGLGPGRGCGRGPVARQKPMRAGTARSATRRYDF